MHQYIYIKIYTLRAFQILKYLVALIFIRVHSPLFFCHFSTATFSRWGVQIRVTLSLLNCDLFTLSVQILVTLSLLNCDLFTLSVQILVTLSLLNCNLFMLSVQILVTLSLLNCNLFTLGVQILVMAPEIYVRIGDRIRNLLLFRMYSGFCSTSLLFGLCRQVRIFIQRCF